MGIFMRLIRDLESVNTPFVPLYRSLLELQLQGKMHLMHLDGKY